MNINFLRRLSVDVEISCHSHLDERWHLDDAELPCGRLYWLRKGVAQTVHHGRTWRMVPGKFYLIPAHTPLALSAPGKFVIDWAHFSAVLPGGIELFDWLKCDYEITPQKPREVQRELNTLVGLHASKKALRPDEVLLSQSALLRLLAFFVETASAHSLNHIRLGHERFGSVLSYIRENLSAPLRVEDLAGLAHLERSYFTRLFRDFFKMSPGQYVKKCRIEQARVWLWTSDLSVAEIAARLGFFDAFHFSKSFKQSTGMSPSNYRQSRQQLPL